MTRKGLAAGVIFSTLAFAVVSLSPNVALAFPISSPAALHDGLVRKVTFWGHPFPYGYTWSLARACTRYIPVETAHGVRSERVWVCRQRFRGRVALK